MSVFDQLDQQGAPSGKPSTVVTLDKGKVAQLPPEFQQQLMQATAAFKAGQMTQQQFSQWSQDFLSRCVAYLEKAGVIDGN